MRKPAALGAALGLAVGGAVAAVSRGQTLVPWPSKVRTAFPVVLGGIAGIASGVTTGALGATVRLVTGNGPGPIASVRPLAIGAVVGTAGTAAGNVAKDRVIGQLTAKGEALDPAFSQPPTDPNVSGSAPSEVDVATLGREGARFVGTATSAQDSIDVTGQERIADPIRVFIGVSAATTIEERVELAMAELRRTGAFDRSVLLVIAPAGSGYANGTPADVMEILSAGDCATVSIGYGVLPSFLSLNKVAVAARTQFLLLEAIAAELDGRLRVPRLYLYGESLGAKVQQGAIPGGIVDLDHYRVTQALWVGTPGGTASDEFHAACSGHSITVDRPEQVPTTFPDGRPRVWFLEHDGDPVVRFRPELAYQRPAWLPADGTRGRNVPETMRWLPGITWAQVAIDTLFATNIKPGDFRSMGHDYRADLATVVPAAFGIALDAQTIARLDARLRELEVARAARINEA